MHVPHQDLRRRPLEAASGGRSGVTSVRALSTEQHDSGMFNCVLMSVKMAAILSTNCN